MLIATFDKDLRDSAAGHLDRKRELLERKPEVKGRGVFHKSYQRSFDF